MTTAPCLAHAAPKAVALAESFDAIFNVRNLKKLSKMLVMYKLVGVGK